jgi:hypothetical protein
MASCLSLKSSDVGGGWLPSGWSSGHFVERSTNPLFDPASPLSPMLQVFLHMSFCNRMSANANPAKACAYRRKNG